MPKVALITGGGRGLGRAFAMALARKGMSIAVASRTAEQLNETVALLEALPVAAIAIPTDVTNEHSVHHMICVAEQRLGPIDLLVNNAGTGPPFGPTWETDSNDWWTNIEINLKGPMLCAKAAIPGMIGRGGGRIINVASGAGTVSIPYMSAYVTGKAALIRFTEVLASELQPHGISVFAIHPGTVRTSMAEGLMQSDAGRRWLPWFRKIFDDNRDESSKPGEELVQYLASGEADMLSGRFFAVPGAPANLQAQTNRIVNENLNVLRIRGAWWK
jgi:NAD(P)-dependent dehydrogenase (short-subunit alcohol dehydrogenase family)